MARQKNTPEREKELADLRDVMSTNGGRRVMYRALIKAGIYTTSFNVEAVNSGSVYFNEGRRNHGLWLMAELEEAAPASFSEMIKENRYEQVD